MAVKDLPISWEANPVTHEYPEHMRLTEPEGETVRVVPATDDWRSAHTDPPPMIDDGARLDTPEARRARNLDDLATWTLGAVTEARRARDCARSFGYHSEVIDSLEEMIECGSKALDQIGLFEDG